MTVKHLKVQYCTILYCAIIFTTTIKMGLATVVGGVYEPQYYHSAFLMLTTNKLNFQQSFNPHTVRTIYSTVPPYYKFEASM